MKVNCPRHDDAVASCAVYEDNAYCFAGCGVIPLSEVGLDGRPVTIKEKEDLDEKFKYILSLPVGNFRGFPLHYSTTGYYLIWDDNSYYKLRKYTDENPKYVGPAGHRQPLFWARRLGSSTLIMVEGEFNALSLRDAFPEYDILSPGSASEFSRDKLSRDLTLYKQYNRIIVIVDKDPAGVLAAINAKSVFLNKIPSISLILMDPKSDCNNIYTEHGAYALREEVEKYL